jgi:hypothetical protein
MKTKHGPPSPTEIEITPAPTFGRGDPPFDFVTTTKGIVKFSSIRVLPENVPPGAVSPENVLKIGLSWQAYSELGSDHGEAVTYGILFDEKFGNLYAKDPTEMLSELGQRLGHSAAARLERYLDELDDKEDNSGHRRIFITAAWADTFTEQYSEVWLAAMAQHAYFIEGNNFAFGYLSALLDKKADTERHFLRGKVTAKSAGLGGATRSSKFSPVREAVLAEMRRLIGKGFSRTNAARITREKGLGTSQAANEKLWDRHHKK